MSAVDAFGFKPSGLPERVRSKHPEPRLKGAITAPTELNRMRGKAGMFAKRIPLIFLAK
jgi:hypothetical protein